ncbi:MAG: glycoside hydrolase family 88 protein [Luteolibacter sp.]
MKIHHSIFAVLGLFVWSCELSAAPSLSDFFGKWPETANPRMVGDKVVSRFLATPHPNFGSPKPPGSITYPEVCTWYGALTFAKASGQAELTKKLVARFEPLFGVESKLIPKPDHVDNTVFGGLPSEIFIQTGDKRSLELGKRFADEQWLPNERMSKALDPPRRAWMELGLSWQTRLWIDDMYMITIAQVQAFRTTGDSQYLDRASREMVRYLKELQEPNGLFYHSPEVPFFWGRGNGWMAAGMTELLRSLPESHPDRPVILEGYRTMMATLKGFQDGDGMWHQLVDDPQSWPETSCTGMFDFALITGVKNGWLAPDVYGPVARKGWLALTAYIDGNGDVREVCVGTNKKNSRDFYLTRPRTTGDMHGQAPLLWCVSALLR